MSVLSKVTPEEKEGGRVVEREGSGCGGERSGGLPGRHIHTLC